MTWSVPDDPHGACWKEIRRLTALLDEANAPLQRFKPGDRVRGRMSDEPGTVIGVAPRGPQGQPAVNVDWDGDAGGPAYEDHLVPVPGSVPTDELADAIGWVQQYVDNDAGPQRRTLGLVLDELERRGRARDELAALLRETILALHATWGTYLTGPAADLLRRVDAALAENGVRR